MPSRNNFQFDFSFAFNFMEHWSDEGGGKRNLEYARGDAVLGYFCRDLIYFLNSTKIKSDVKISFKFN
jgi:hypothetical protein